VALGGLLSGVKKVLQILWEMNTQEYFRHSVKKAVETLQEKCLEKRGDPLGTFATVLPDVFIGCIKWKL
jgi:hypothetical protein